MNLSLKPSLKIKTKIYIDHFHITFTTAFPIWTSKKCRPKIPAEQAPHHTVTFWVCKNDWIPNVCFGLLEKAFELFAICKDEVVNLSSKLFLLTREIPACWDKRRTGLVVFASIPLPTCKIFPSDLTGFFLSACLISSS